MLYSLVENQRHDLENNGQRVACANMVSAADSGLRIRILSDTDGTDTTEESSLLLKSRGR